MRNAQASSAYPSQEEVIPAHMIFLEPYSGKSPPQ